MVLMDSFLGNITESLLASQHKGKGRSISKMPRVCANPEGGCLG